MATIITVAQRKGGVGKTTMAICVAAELGRRGHDVALVDVDPQRSACHWAELGNLEMPVYEMGLDEMPVAAWAREIRQIKANLLVLDTAPTEREMGATIALADLILVPCTASGLDIEATAHTMTIINAVRRRRSKPVKVLLVPNRIDRRTLEGRQLVEELRQFKEPLAPSVASRSAFVRAFSVGQSVASYAPGQAADADIRTLTDAVEKALPRRK
ncbi:AAA family ATPase [Bradyrhizobium sp. HKCCYLR20261]|uniref:nucleotide-binding protein n=1 Tax=Bradyrhizobium sp. HKCCYLR20261 TaxID=3420760 RepID=UPI003EBE7659